MGKKKNMIYSKWIGLKKKKRERTSKKKKRKKEGYDEIVCVCVCVLNEQELTGDGSNNDQQHTQILVPNTIQDHESHHKDHSTQCILCRQQ